MGELKRRGQIWWIRYYKNGKRHEESSGSEKEGDAKSLLRLREGDIERGVAVTPKVGRIRFDEAVTDVLNDYRTNRKRSLDDVERRIEKHLKPFFGNRRMASITTADIREYIASRQKETTVARKAYTFTARDGTVRHVAEQRRPIAGVSNGEINRELTALKRSFNLAIQAGKLLQKPHIPFLKEDNVRVGFFERDQFLGYWRDCLSQCNRPRPSLTSRAGESTARFCRSSGDRWTSALARSGSIPARRRMERDARSR